MRQILIFLFPAGLSGRNPGGEDPESGLRGQQHHLWCGHCRQREQFVSGAAAAAAGRGIPGGELRT